VNQSSIAENRIFDAWISSQTHPRRGGQPEEIARAIPNIQGDPKHSLQFFWHGGFWGEKVH
jgi:hypothetical protein